MHLIIALALLGVAVWLISLIKMDATFFQIIRVVAIVIAIVLVLRAFGVNVPVGNLLR